MQIKIDKSKKELKEHGSFGFPVQVSYEALSRYPSGSFLLHWHPEIELTLILEGELEYQINGRTYHLVEGEGIFGNSNTLHTGYSLSGGECRYLSFTFHPKMIYGYEGSLIQRKYVEPVLISPRMKAIHFRCSEIRSKEILKLLADIHQWTLKRPDAYELKIKLVLGRIWELLFSYMKELPEAPAGDEKNIQRIKTMLSFMQEHYKEKLTLEDIASSVNICKSECCRFFKKHTSTTIFDYLLSFRVEQSLGLLTGTEYSITQIAEMAGFSDSCYYTKIFKKYKGCTPREFRKKEK